MHTHAHGQHMEGLAKSQRRSGTHRSSCPARPPGLTLSRTTWGIFTPFRKHLIWGIPLPAATGWKERDQH